MRSHQSPALVLIILLSLLLLWAAPAAACRALITLDEAIVGAEYIVIGQVSSAGDPYWFEDMGDAASGPIWRAIITPLEVSVTESFKGPAAPGDLLRLGQLGGQIGEVRMISTAEQYIGSGTYLLFLSGYQGEWAHIGLRVEESWSLAGETLGANYYWPDVTKLSQLKAQIREAVLRDTGASPFTVVASEEAASIATIRLPDFDDSANQEAAETPSEPGKVLIAILLGSWAVQAVRGRRVMP